MYTPTGSCSVKEGKGESWVFRFVFMLFPVIYVEKKMPWWVFALHNNPHAFGRRIPFFYYMSLPFYSVFSFLFFIKQFVFCLSFCNGQVFPKSHASYGGGWGAAERSKGIDQNGWNHSAGGKEFHRSINPYRFHTTSWLLFLPFFSFSFSLEASAAGTALALLHDLISARGRIYEGG